MKIVTILLSILDAVAAVIVALVIYKNSDPMYLGLDTFVGWATPMLGLVTAVPAFLLATKNTWRKTALSLALAFPVGFVALLVGVFFYFTYVL